MAMTEKADGQREALPQDSNLSDYDAARIDRDVASLSQWQLIWRRFKRNRMAMVGAVILIVLYTIAIFGDFLAPYQLQTRFTRDIYSPPTWPRFVDANGQFHLRPFVYRMDRTVNEETLENTYTPDPSVAYPINFFVKGDPYKFWGIFTMDRHLFGVPDVPIFLIGSDRQGRDMLSRCIKGSQISLSIGLVGVFLGITFGSVLGVASGYYGGIIDDLVQRFSEILLSIPQIPLWMALAAILPVTWSPLRVYFGITIILSLLNWGSLARQLRGRTLSLREEDYTMAAYTAGASDWWIIMRHMIPNNASHIIVLATLSIPGMILGETALSFMGLGIRAPMTSWGVLLEEAQNVRTIVFNPWLIFPALLVILVVVGYNFLGDGLRDAADPFTK
jgi:peptide/nickel transport system permease protein